MNNTQSDSGTPDRRHELVFWCFAVVVLFLYLGHNALWGSENRWAEITREMILTGDYLHPAINWQIYFDKPPLSYWLIVPFMVVCGIGELAPRIPSALAALVALYGTIELGKSLYDRRTGLLAGWLTLGCYGFLFWGRTAAADMANVAAIVLAVSFFYKMEKNAGFFSYLCFYLILFLGALTKGLPAIVMPIAFLAPHLLRDNNWKAHLKFSHLAAFLIGALIYLLPFWAAAVAPLSEPLRYPAVGIRSVSGLELVWRENVVRAFHAFDHKDPVYSYLYNLPRILLPWFLLILPAIIGYLRAEKPLPRRTGELISGILLIFILFTVSTSRRWYYILPLAPFCMLLGAEAIRRGLEREDPWTLIPLRCMRYLMIAAASLAVATAAIGILIPPLLQMDPPLIAQVWVPIFGVLAVAVLILENHPRITIERWSGLPQRAAATVIAGDILLAAGLCVLLPSFTAFRTEKPFFGRLDANELKGMDSGSILFFGNGTADPNFIFYTLRHSPVATARGGDKTHRGFRNFIAKNAGKKVAIFCKNHPTRDLPQLAAAAKAAGIGLDIRKPTLREPYRKGFGSEKKLWAVWILDVPAVFSPKQTAQPSTESKP